MIKKNSSSLNIFKYIFNQRNVFNVRIFLGGMFGSKLIKETKDVDMNIVRGIINTDGSRAMHRIKLKIDSKLPDYSLSRDFWSPGTSYEDVIDILDKNFKKHADFYGSETNVSAKYTRTKNIKNDETLHELCLEQRVGKDNNLTKIANYYVRFRCNF